MAIGYILSGKAHRAASDFVPSLIGVAPDQVDTTGDDMYFTSTTLDPAMIAGKVNGIERTRWVAYDSLPADRRDPILIVRLSNDKSFYTLLSEIVEVAAEIEDETGDGKLFRLATFYAEHSGSPA